MKFFKNLFKKSVVNIPKVVNNPEDDFFVTITEELVRVEHPLRKTEQIKWADINQIWIVTTSTGPFMPDVFLALMGEKSGCLIPQGAKGYQEIYDIVSKYKNFDYENVIKSMLCTEDARFILWKKD